MFSGGLKTEVCSIDTIYVIQETLSSKKGEIISKEFYVEYRDIKVLEDEKNVSSDVEELFVWCLEKADINTDMTIINKLSNIKTLIVPHIFPNKYSALLKGLT